MNKKILVIVGGSIKKIERFKDVAIRLGLDVTLASFSDLNYTSFGESNHLNLHVNDREISSFDIIYFRMIGKRIEDASLLAQYCKKHGIRIVDSVYTQELLLPSSIAKSIEVKKLIEANVAIPRTIYGSSNLIIEKSRREFGYPYVVKSTSGRKARDAWLIDSAEKEKEVEKILIDKENAGLRFFGQEFVAASQRERVLVIGGKALAAITRPTKWRKRIANGLTENPEGIKDQIKPIPTEYINLAEKAIKAVDLEIAGVDILKDDISGRLLVLEVNAAPSWKLIEKDCNIAVEEEILKFLAR